MSAFCRAVIAGPDPSVSGRFEYSLIDPDHHRNHLDTIIGRTKYLQIRFLHHLLFHLSSLYYKALLRFHYKAPIGSWKDQSLPILLLR